ncbi:MAG TPA: AsmA-like C-terminal region-containing protein [Methylomirabilota bacterium]|nr:AsmA-like C-terminal region-containing protein [Methylomirabilota bacterium]
MDNSSAQRNVSTKHFSWPMLASSIKRPRKWVALIIVATAIGATAVVQSLNVLVARHRDQVQQELQKVLGQDVSFEGVEVNLLGWPGFVAREFRVADDPRFAATPALRAKELILGVSALYLFVGRIVIDSLTLKEPEFQMIVDESGALNVTNLMGRKSQMPAVSNLKLPAGERRRNSVTFSIASVRVENGKIEYLDRSVKEPAELRVKNIALTVKGLDPARATKISLAASLSEGVGPDVHLTGQFEPASRDLSSWWQREFELSLRLDSLYVPVVARAIAGLRDKLPAELDVTGPMAFQATLRGTAQRPRLEDVDLRIPLFGSSDYNARINGRVEFSERRSWDDARLQGRLTVEPIALGQLRKLRFFEDLLPAAMSADGTIGVYSRFEGSWENLRVGALLRADKAGLRYRDWLHKPAQIPASITSRMIRQKKTVQFLASELVVGPAKMEFSGRIDLEPAPRARFNLRSQAGPVAAWNQLVTPLAYRGVAGNAQWDILVDSPMNSLDDRWSIKGYVKLTDASFERREGGRRLDHLNGQLSFAGKQARIDYARFRLGASAISLEGTVTDLFEPRLSFRLRSADLRLADLLASNDAPPLSLRDASADGEIGRDSDRFALSGSLSAAQASLPPFNVVHLRADVTLSPAGLVFKNLTAETLHGALYADGYWASADDRSRQFQIRSQFDAVQINELFSRWLPELKDRMDGQMTGRAQFDATSPDGASLKETLKGSGEASVRRGVIKNFNLIGQLLRRGDARNFSPDVASRLPTGFAELVQRADTPFDSLKANFTVDHQRIQTDSLVVTTPDYAVTGAGWIGFDRSTKWNGMLVLSPRLTQELQREYRIIRYLLDRRGRLSIGFRVEGKIPDVKVRLENRALAQALRAGPSARGEDSDSSGKAGPEPKERRPWLPDALDQILQR